MKLISSVIVITLALSFTISASAREESCVRNRKTMRFSPIAIVKVKSAFLPFIPTEDDDGLGVKIKALELKDKTGGRLICETNLVPKSRRPSWNVMCEILDHFHEIFTLRFIIFSNSSTNSEMAYAQTSAMRICNEGDKKLPLIMGSPPNSWYPSDRRLTNRFGSITVSLFVKWPPKRPIRDQTEGT